MIGPVPEAKGSFADFKGTLEVPMATERGCMDLGGEMGPGSLDVPGRLAYADGRALG